MDGVTATSLRQITDQKGSVMHALKASEDAFFGFGEAYFSSVNKNMVKGWKRHRNMILNLVVVRGNIRFVIYNGEEFSSHVLGTMNYQRLTIMPNLWVAFEGLDESNMLLNIASIEHDPLESDSINIEEIKYDWAHN